MNATSVANTASIGDFLLVHGLVAADRLSELISEALSALRVDVLDGDYDGYDVTAEDHNRISSYVYANCGVDWQTAL